MKFMKPIIILSIVFMSTPIYAERISEAEFNVNYKNYKNELARDQAALKKLNSESSFEATVKSNLLTCKVWDSKLAMYKLALENKQIQDAGHLANNLKNEILPFQLAIQNLSGTTFEKNCETIEKLSIASGIIK